MEVYKVGDEFKQCIDRDRYDKYDKGCCDRDFRHDDCCHDDDDNWDLSNWLPILIIVFLLCGGTNIFGNKDECCDQSGFNGSWVLILILVFLFLGNQKDGKGFLGGLF